MVRSGVGGGVRRGESGDGDGGGGGASFPPGGASMGPGGAAWGAALGSELLRATFVSHPVAQVHGEWVFVREELF